MAQSNHSSERNIETLQNFTRFFRFSGNLHPHLHTLMKTLCHKSFVALVATLSAATFATAETYTDNFDSAHDYQTAGVTGTLWDGLLSNGGFDSQPLSPVRSTRELSQRPSLNSNFLAFQHYTVEIKNYETKI